MVQPEYQKKGIATAMFKLAYERVRPDEATGCMATLICAMLQAKQTGATLALSTGNPQNVCDSYACLMVVSCPSSGKGLRAHRDGSSGSPFVGLALGRVAELGIRVEDEGRKLIEAIAFTRRSCF